MSQYPDTVIRGQLRGTRDAIEASMDLGHGASADSRTRKGARRTVTTVPLREERPERESFFAPTAISDSPDGDW